MVSVPETLLAEIDLMLSLEKMNRSEFFQEAVFLYLSERKKQILREQMKRGYLEMAQINLNMVKDGVSSETEIKWTTEVYVE